MGDRDEELLVAFKEVEVQSRLAHAHIPSYLFKRDPEAPALAKARPSATFIILVASERCHLPACSCARFPYIPPLLLIVKPNEY